MSPVILPQGVCLVWQCRKPLCGPDGRPLRALGVAGFCWPHYRQMHRPVALPCKPKPPCTVCGEPSEVKGLCRRHYDQQWRRTTPTREAMLSRARKRDRKRRRKPPVICKRQPRAGDVINIPCPDCGHINTLHIGCSSCPVCELLALITGLRIELA